MNINQMLDELSAMNRTISGQASTLNDFAQRISGHSRSLQAIDGGTGNVNTRQAMATLAQATESCKNAAIALATAQAKAVAYIASVRR